MTGGASVGDGTPWRVFASEATARLAAAGIDSPEVSVRRIIERAAGFEGAEYALGLSAPATERAMGFFDQMVERRLRGEPLQYVLGEWSFRTLDLMVDRRVLIPRPETEVVVEVALGELDRLAADAPLVVDLGTGSGAIAFSVAVERPRTRVWATDVSGDALDVARANLVGVGAPAAHVTVAEGSWFEALPGSLRGEVHLIVTNPPYVAASEPLPPVVGDWEPAGALVPGPTGLEAIEAIVAGSPAWLARPGVLVIEIGATQGDEALALVEAAGFAEARVAPDLWGRPRALVARVA